MQDSISKGRSTRIGSGNPNNKLSDDDIRSIRLLYDKKLFKYAELAQMFNIHKATVGSIIRRKYRQEVT